MFKIVIFKGGVGNQLFQYCLIDYLSRQGHTVYYVDDTFEHNGLEIDKYFDVVLKPLPKLYFLIYKILRKFFNRILWNLPINGDILSRHAIMYDGYWQDRKYIAEDLPIGFKDLPLTQKNQGALKQIQSSNSICIHVRRGDYLTPVNQFLFGGVCTPEYYNKAINILSDKIKNPTYFIFSDDIEWCKNNIKLKNVVYVDWNTGKDSIYDMYLMSHCKSLIIANSSFSYWAARLSQSCNVIYPKKWFANNIPARDIFPDNWIAN